jgi:hypothetical protein
MLTIHCHLLVRNFTAIVRVCHHETVLGTEIAFPALATYWELKTTSCRSAFCGDQASLQNQPFSFHVLKTIRDKNERLILTHNEYIF